MTSKLVVNGLYKIYGPDPDAALRLLDEGVGKNEIHERSGQVVGVNNASFAVQEGEIFVIMGMSGCGKSTLVRMLNRLIDPTRGEVRIDDRDVTKMTRRELIALRRRDFAMVFQSFALLPHLSVHDNAAFGLSVAGVEEAERTRRAADALDTVGLSAFAESRPDELSGGMQQRVGLARALAVNPSILLMDEAFSALDPVIRTEMQDELLKIQGRAARTVVFISHDLDEAMRIGDRIAIMGQEGEIVQVGAPEDIVRKPANRYVRSFFKGVDLSKVLSARHVCRDDAPRLEGAAAEDIEGALHVLRARDAEYGYVLDEAGRLKGVVRRDRLDELTGPRRAGLEDAFLPNVASLSDDTPVHELIETVAAAAVPLPVLDKDGRYVGAISPQALLETLAESR